MEKIGILFALVILVVLWLYYQNVFLEDFEKDFSESIEERVNDSKEENDEETRTGEGFFNEARKEAFRNEIRQFEIILNSEYYILFLDKSFDEDVVYVFKEGQNMNENEIDEYHIPGDGKAVLKRTGHIAFAITDNYWCATKGFEENEIKIEVLAKECFHEDLSAY